MYRTPFNRLIQHGDVEGKSEAQRHFEEFYQDIFIEMSKFGVIEELHVCQNLGAHLNGNVYIKYQTEEDAANALANSNGRVYDGVPVQGEPSPVTDFKEARCKEYDVGECIRGGYCNFIHLREPSKELKTNLFVWQRYTWYQRGRRSPEYSRDVSPDRDEHRYRSSSWERKHRRHRDRSSSRERRHSREHRSRDRSSSRSRYSRDRSSSRERRKRDRSSSRERRRSRDRSHSRERRHRDHGYSHDRNREYSRGSEHEKDAAFEHERKRRKDTADDYHEGEIAFQPPPPPPSD